jgi:hypothetical protein
MRRLAPLAIVLAAAVLVPGGANGAGPDWKALERPLHLPALGPGGACPASALSSRVTGQKYGVGGGLGPGPVYPILGRPGLVAYFRSDLGPWAYQKVLWFVLPDYIGPVLIRGRRLGGTQLMRFDNGVMPAKEIRISPGETVTWTGQVPGSRGRPSAVRVLVPGCYGVQIDGTSFSTVVVFPVSTAH